MDEIKENEVSLNEPNAEYVHLIEDVNVWFIDYVIGVAFRTPINFLDKMNGLSESGRPYREFSDYKDMQHYLDKLTGQEIVIESSIDPRTETEFDSRIVWETKLKEFVPKKIK
ncbi:MAG: hypothetical protein WAZ77_16330 [Candidatus Nitrosopolaris sp.]|jgi:hypothetical protein